MWKSDLLVDKYQYVRINPYFVRLIGVLGILSTLFMGYGLLKYARIEPVYLLVFGPLIVIFIANKLLRFFIQLFYPKFSIKKHENFVKTFWETHDEPTVNIFLPWAGEGLDIHEEVVKAVANLDYKNYEVYMLDDVGNEDHRRLAEKYGYHYLSRPNKGVYKKSGNLEFGYRNSSGEFVLILDADFIPAKDALHDLIPYIASDPQIGILQTPQYFEQNKDVHKRSLIEFGGGNIVEDFYKITLPCRDEFKAGMCVGTSAIYRRDAILKLNGTPKVHASEDLATGLLITRFGYYVKYLPLIVSMGKSPDTFQGYFKQHMRWCSGNLVFARYWPHAHLSLMARFIYIINPLYYLSEAFSILFSFQFLVLLYFHSDSLSIVNTLYFLPYIILSRGIVPLTRSNKTRLGTRLAAMSNTYTYFYTYIRMLTKGVPSWLPTGVKVSKLHEDFMHAFDIGTAISTFYIACFIFVILSRPSVFGNYNAYVVLGWTFYSVFWHALFLTAVLDYMHPFRLENLSSKFDRTFLYVKTHSMLLLFFILLGVAISDGVITYFTPNTPTALAINNFLSPKETLAKPKLAMVETKTASQSAVLAAATQEKNVAPDYKMTVSRGDTLLSLTRTAVASYAAENTLTLSDKEIQYAATHIITTEEINSLIRPGQEIEFDGKKIGASVDLAERTYNPTQY